MKKPSEKGPSMKEPRGKGPKLATKDEFSGFIDLYEAATILRDTDLEKLERATHRLSSDFVPRGRVTGSGAGVAEQEAKKFQAALERLIDRASAMKVEFRRFSMVWRHAEAVKFILATQTLVQSPRRGRATPPVGSEADAAGENPKG